MKTKIEVTTAIESTRPRSAWSRGVKAYALELLDEHEGELTNARGLLNGAANWAQYSEGGCALIYDADIAARLCSPSELRKTRNGERQPNSRETWIDCQARALSQAAALISRHIA